MGLADLGGEQESDWQAYPDTYVADGDNYLDLCLKLDSDADLEEIYVVTIREGVVYPPRGTGDNLNLGVYVETNVGYPYIIEVDSGKY